MKPVIPANSKRGTGHYVPGMISNGMLYISGQLPVNPQTGETVTGDVSAHAQSALDNVERVLAAAGLTPASVVQCRLYIPDVAYWEEVNKVYADFFGDHRPARVVVPSRNLYNGALVEVEAVAELNASM